MVQFILYTVQQDLQHPQEEVVREGEESIKIHCYNRTSINARSKRIVLIEGCRYSIRLDFYSAFYTAYFGRSVVCTESVSKRLGNILNK